MGLEILRRIVRYIFKGIPERRVYVNVSQVDYNCLLKGKKVIVTGGGSGIGLAIAKKYSEMGAEVLIVGRNEEKLKRAIEESGYNMRSYVCDITDFAELENDVKKMIENMGGKIDVLVNNAGIWQTNNIFSLEEEMWDRVFDINLKAHYFFTQYCLRFMHEESEILFVGSENANIDCSNPYTLSKCAIHKLVKALAKELIGRGIRVNGIAPGPTLSEINKTNPENGLQRGEKYRVLLAEEIAEIAAFLVSDASKCVSGQIVLCDEGDSLR